MPKKSSAVLLIAAFWQTLFVNVGGLYTKNSLVLQVDGSKYDHLIARSNQLSVSASLGLGIKFYAPWCGHCQNLKPVYEKVAKHLDGLAQVAAVNCDDDSNKPFCGQMGIRGFPTLKVITPSKKPGQPRVEDYNGARTAKAIVEYMVDKIPNHVKKITDKELDGWLKEANDTAKAILFTEKPATSALLRALAIDYLGSISFAQIRSKETSAVQTFGIKKFPTIVLLPGGGKEAISYGGELKKSSISDFLGQVAKASADPKPSKSTASTTSEATESPETSSRSVSPSPSKAPALNILSTTSDLRKECLAPKTGTCVLVLGKMPESLDSEPPAGAFQVFTGLAEISHKHSLRKGHLFPFYAVPDTVEDVGVLRNKLELKKDSVIDVIALNVKRGWWQQYDPGEEDDFSAAKLETWIDAIRLGEGAKKKLPDGVVLEEQEEVTEPAKEPEKGDGKEPKVESPKEPKQKPVKEEPTTHNEL
ncbi:uncharacterized protein PADG_07815 [Paracoccidioides brasiliensis Pb18]|uniref:protein disulfide-isomerase n=1 Tax=Paracoccidioides brasiliensis (strain Pb18) TaxID=502780 RepID=C1GKM9_PARBD|nr:uncharacterized protein PADG_07815 [Paracoccidioides brasiliensis Pb18]EEH42995.2 hypothetical protein PADG_07815 [Paracoccidioides brasiliensis Pb18]